MGLPFKVAAVDDPAALDAAFAGARWVAVPAGGLQRDFDFGAGPSRCMAAPWPDPYSAFFTTGAPDIEAYLEADSMTRAAYGALSVFAPALRLPLARQALESAA